MVVQATRVSLFYQVLVSYTLQVGLAGLAVVICNSLKTDNNENEIIINVPVAIGMMSASFMWPFAAWKELVSGEVISS